MKRVVLSVLFSLLLPALAHAQLYGISLNGSSDSNPGPSSLYSIDPATGVGTLIGDIGYAVNAIAVDPTTGLMYASTTAWNATGEGFNGLLLIDPSTGAGTEIGPFGDSYWAILGLTFNSAGELWGWHDPNEDDPVMIDKATGAATTVGDSGLNTGGQVVAFDPSDVLFVIQGSAVYTIDQTTGAATSMGSLAFDPGSGGAAFDGSGALWASRDNGRTQDAFIRITNIAGDSFTDLDTDIEYLNGVTFGDVEATGTAYFQVTKTFSDGSTGDIDVTLTCNGGTPLQQSFTISGGGPGVTFTVMNLPDAGANCEVTESGGVAGYTPVLNGGEGCSWTGVTGGMFSCMIENVPEPTAVEIVSGVTGADDPNIDDSFETAISCEGVSETADGPYSMLDVTVTTSPYTANWYADPDGGADCTVTLTPTSSAAEGDTCEFSFDLGDEEAGCTVVATVFFEGIPTLSQYGMAIMVLLMLGVGFVGMRRFV